MTPHNLSAPGQLDLFADAAPPEPDAAARQRIANDLASTLFVEAGAGAGKTTMLVQRVLALVTSGVPMGSIAAITFTEKAAAELRLRLRRKLTEAHQHEATGPRERIRSAIEQLDDAPIGTVHAFAARLLREYPLAAGLPPRFAVADEINSELAFAQRWTQFVDHLLSDPAQRRLVSLIVQGDLGIKALRTVANGFDANWDLVRQRISTELPLPADLRIAQLVAATTDVIDRANPPDGDKQNEVIADIRQALAALVEVDASAPTFDVGSRLQALTALQGGLAKGQRRGNARDWRTAQGLKLDELRDGYRQLAEEINERRRSADGERKQWLGAELRTFTLDAAGERMREGKLEFHDLLVLTRDLLHRDAIVRRKLHERYSHVLLDEFQDTDPIQLEIATLLTADPASIRADTQFGVPLPGRLFVVGDPKQSIYRFRRADIGAYLQARAQLGAEVEYLVANFRTTSPVVAWVNQVFREVIKPADDTGLMSQPEFVALAQCRLHPPEAGSVTILGRRPHDRGSADEIRQAEAGDVADVVEQALTQGWLVEDDGTWRACRPGDITVLLPARTSLPSLEMQLRARGLPYRAENSSLVYASDDIRSLMLALRALCDHADALSLLQALRSPLFSCTDVSLHHWTVELRQALRVAEIPDDLVDHPVGAALAELHQLSIDAYSLSPADVISRFVSKRRMFEVAAGETDARDVWRRLRFVTDQARAWSDAGGAGLRQYLQWVALHSLDGRVVADVILPESDNDAVRIMTIHAAKGLEFAITIVSGMTSQQRANSGPKVIFPSAGDWALKTKSGLDPVYEAYVPIDEQMSADERARLLYVACTRARDHLVVSVHRKAPSASSTVRAQPSNAELLANAFDTDELQPERAIDDLATVDSAHRFRAAPHRADATADITWLDAAQWRAEHQRAVESAATSSVLSATALAAQTSALHPLAMLPPATIDPGLAKDAVDADLPAWQRGRYGTAIGRAVHGVLQAIDFTNPHDLVSLSRSQASAEGIPQEYETIEALSRSALGSSTVQRARSLQSWKEMYVAATVAETLIEGYIDLLMRDETGRLVIADYKTDHIAYDEQWSSRLAKYRDQLAAYAVALEAIVGERPKQGVLIICTTGAAHEIVLENWDEAIDSMRDYLLTRQVRGRGPEPA